MTFLFLCQNLKGAKDMATEVFRVEKTRDYTIMSNHHLKNIRLSLKSKGLLTMMLSLPEDWDYTLRGLSRICREGIDAIRTSIKELVSEGYEAPFKLYGHLLPGYTTEEMQRSKAAEKAADTKTQEKKPSIRQELKSIKSAEKGNPKPTKKRSDPEL